MWRSSTETNVSWVIVLFSIQFCFQIFSKTILNAELYSFFKCKSLCSWQYSSHRKSRCSQECSILGSIFSYNSPLLCNSERILTFSLHGVCMPPHMKSARCIQADEIFFGTSILHAIDLSLRSHFAARGALPVEPRSRCSTKFLKRGAKCIAGSTKLLK